ncbi:MAG: class I SAM-dependent methyltransferase [Gammaproteobacteria bacterium]
MAEVDVKEIRKKILGISWFHRIDIHGVVTLGCEAARALQWKSDAIDKDLSGKDVLDIGAWDGCYTFLAESRGARRVVAIDCCQGPCTPRGFKMAKELLSSKAEHHILDVRQLDRLDGTFDLILFFGVYYHLEDPYSALKQIFDKLKPGGILLLEGLVRAGSKPYLYAYRPEEVEPTTYCAATVPWLRLACQRIGFSSADFVSRYPGDNAWERAVRFVAWHLRLHARRFKKAHRAIIKARAPA